MNLHLLRVFIAVVDARSFSRAAETLGISQPAASKAVRELESQLGTVLLDRQGRTFRTTAPGQALHDYGRSIFALEREADEAVRAFSALETGHLVIGASTTIATYWLPAYVAAFTTTYPGIEVSVRSANTARIVELLLDCRIDVALVEGAVGDARLDVRHWRKDEMIVVAPREAPDDPLGAAGTVWVTRESGSGSREAADRLLDDLGIERPRLIEVGSNEAIVQTVAAGAGLGVVPRICARDQLALGRVRKVPLRRGAIFRDLFRIRLPQRPVTEAALAFEALLAE